MKWWAERVIRHRYLALVLTALLTLGAIASLRSLKVIIDPDEALPQTHPYVVTTNRVEQLFGDKLTSVIGIEVQQGSILDPANLAVLGRISARLDKLHGVVPGSVVSAASDSVRIPVPSPAGPVALSLREAAAKLGTGTLGKLLQTESPYLGLLLSRDFKTAQIIAEFRKVPEGFSSVDREVRAAVREELPAEMHAWVGGVPAFLSLLERYSARMAWLFPLALLVIGLIHFEAFRTVQALVLPLVTALLAVVWALGILGLFHQPIDVFNASTPILILAVAAGHAVQILKRYYEEFAALRETSGLSPAEMNREAVLRSLCTVGPVMAAACLVAALGFFSLVIFEIKSIQVFGLFTGAGILSALALELGFIPALRSCLPAPGEREYRRERQPSAWDHLIARLLNLVLHRRKWIFLSAGFAGIACALLATRVEIENSQKSYFWGNIPERRDDELLNEKLSGTNSLYLLVDAAAPGGALAPDILQGIERVQRYLAAQPLVGKSISIADFLAAASHGVPRLPSKPPAPYPRDMLAALSGPEQGQNAVSRFLDPTAQFAKLHILLKTDRTRKVQGLIHELERVAREALPGRARVMVGGGVAGGVALNEVMVREKILNIVQIMGAVFLVSALLFRSLSAGALILVPLLAAVLANFGVMGLLGIPLQIATALVSAMAVGIGADYGIYLSYRLREELANPQSSESEAVRRAFFSAGKATLFVSSAVGGGFGVLVFSLGFNLHFWLGLLIGIAMLTSSLAALTLFPALVLWLRPRFIFAPASEYQRRGNGR